MYGCFLHPRFDHPTFLPPGLSTILVRPLCAEATVIMRHLHASATPRILHWNPRRNDHHWGGIKRAPTGSKSKRLTLCAIHACEFASFPAETIETVGALVVGLPNTASNRKMWGGQTVGGQNNYESNFLPKNCSGWYKPNFWLHFLTRQEMQFNFPEKETVSQEFMFADQAYSPQGWPFLNVNPNSKGQQNIILFLLPYFSWHCPFDSLLLFQIFFKI